jgi:hypothetical protein
MDDMAQLHAADIKESYASGSTLTILHPHLLHLHNIKHEGATRNAEEIV